MLVSSWWIGIGHHLSPFVDMEVVDFFHMIILNKLRVGVRLEREVHDQLTHLHDGRFNKVEELECCSKHRGDNLTHAKQGTIGVVSL